MFDKLIVFAIITTLFPGSAAVAQLAVNQLVVGSNPTPGAKVYRQRSAPLIFTE